MSATSDAWPIYLPASQSKPLDAIVSHVARGGAYVVASTAERATLLAALTSAGQPAPSAAVPLLTWRADAPADRALEYTTDGTTWHTIVSAANLDQYLPKNVRKLNTESLANNATLQNDDELFITLPVGLWAIHAIIRYTAPATADFKWAWTLTGGTSSAVARDSLSPAVGMTSAVDHTMRASISGLGTAIAAGADGSGTSVLYDDLLISVTAGSSVLQLQWAQNVASATAATVNSQSRLTRTYAG